ncbi:MAG: hypothetical protein OHK0037_11410 [Elainellaceae cyanobacterium]
MFNNALNNAQRKLSVIQSDIQYHAALKSHAPHLPNLSSEDQHLVDCLRTEGVAITSLEKLGLPSTPELLKETQSWLERMKAAHTPQLLDGYCLPQIYTMTDLAAFSNWAVEQRLINVIENYVGLPVAFQGVHLRRDFPNEKQGGTLLWHKDGEDRRIVKIFVYLEDVTEEHGPFEYIPKSITDSKRVSWQIYYQVWRSGFIGIEDHKMQQIVPRSAWKSCPGPAGTVVMAALQDIYHHGRTRQIERPLLFYVYTANPPKRPDLCKQYSDETYARPDVLKQKQLVY